MEFIQPNNKNALGKLQNLSQNMSLEEIKIFCEGMMNAIIVVQDTFRKRFPKEYEKWNEQFKGSE